MGNLPGLCRRNWDVFVLAGILLLGGWLRVTRLELMEFKADECRLHALALKQAQGDMQLAGLASSAGIHNPAMAVNLFTIPALFTKDPVRFALLPAILNTIALFAGYVLARHWMSRPAALVAMFLFAVSPWAVLTSRKIWAQDLLPLFTIAFFLAVMAWLRKGRAWHVVAIFVTLAVINQIHYSTLAFWPIVAVAAWQRRRKGILAYWLAGAAIYIVMWLPFIVYEAGTWPADYARYEYEESRGLDTSVQENIAKAVCWQVALMGQGGFDFVLGGSSKAFGTTVSLYPWLTVVFSLVFSSVYPWLTVVFLLVFSSALVATLFALKKQPDLWVLVTWVGLPTLVLSFHAIIFHYFIACYPVTFLMTGVLVDAATVWAASRIPSRSFRAALATVAIAFLLVIGSSEVKFFTRFLDFVSARGGAQGDYGITYRDKLNVATYLEGAAGKATFTLSDRTGARPAEESYLYLYRMIGGSGTMVHLPAEGLPKTDLVFAVIATGVRERFWGRNAFIETGTVPVGPLSVVSLKLLAADDVPASQARTGTSSF
jgi:hypothetical protein